jgi:uncharacterized SAM-dependent methyltransferase
VDFLAGLHAQCDEHGALLLGVDLAKDPGLLHRAYDDALGVTAAFNLNVLRHANALAGTDFDAYDWRHQVRYDVDGGCIQMHLEARRDLVVRWDGGARQFRQGQTIHTESSYKYTRDSLAALLRDAGWRLETV